MIYCVKGEHLKAIIQFKEYVSLEEVNNVCQSVREFLEHPDYTCIVMSSNFDITFINAEEVKAVDLEVDIPPDLQKIDIIVSKVEPHV